VILLLGVLKLRDTLVREAFTLILFFAGTGILTFALSYLRSLVTSDFLVWLIRGFLSTAIFLAMTVILVAGGPGGGGTRELAKAGDDSRRE